MHHKKINIERAFLVLSLSFGFIFSIIFPVFYEGDAQFHFDYATYQADVVVDRASIGSNANFGYDVELKSVQNDEYFNKYFKTKLKKVNKMEVHDQRAYTSRTIANDLSHIIPAVGVWLGYHIYPSIGVMIVIARILATLFYSFTLYLIIKKVKYGKNLFVFTALTPVMAIQGYSLSYDSFSFVLSCGLIASQINFIFREKIYLKDIVSLFLFSLSVLLFSKVNMQLLLLISIVAGLSRIINLKKAEEVFKKYFFAILLVSTIFFVCGYIWFSKNHGGISIFSLRMFNTFFTIESEQYTRGIFLGIFGNYTSSYSLPWWCLYGYSIILFLLIFSERLPEISKIVAVVGASAFFLNIVGTTALYSTFSNSVHDSNDITQVIGGQLGRYYTPLLPSLIYLSNIFPIHFELREDVRGKMVIYWSIFCLLLLMIVTIYGFYIMKIPAFVQ